MATKARQQYFADEISLQKQRREFSLEDNIKQKIDSVETGAQVNTIETVKVNGTALTPDANKAVNVPVPNVIDNLYSTSTNDALSAKQGKVLYDYLQNIASRGRFLSNWNSATGLPVTNPTESPYPYKAGDYYSISNVATGGGTNYRPDGSSYTIGQASTTVETEEVNVSDFYLYDGTNWLLLVNTARQIAVDSSLSTTSTNPVENRVVTNAINAKVGVSTDYGNDLLDGAKIWLGTETDYSSMISRDSNTMYIQYVTSSPTPPSPGRQPGVNTIAYFPLNGDADDHSGKQYTGTWTGTATYETLASGIQVGKFDGSNYITTSWNSLMYPSDFTILIWFKRNSTGMTFLFTKGTASTGGGLHSGFYSDNNYIMAFFGDNNPNWFITDTDWHLGVTTFSGGVKTCYLDTETPVSYSNTTYIGFDSTLYIGYNSGYKYNGQISNLIFENKCWTAQEVADYYDQTKGDYGIS